MNCQEAWLWVALLLCGFPIAKGDLEPVLSKCCHLGTSWANQKKECEDTYAPSIPGITKEHEASCSLATSVCCLRQYRNQLCELGKAVAKHGGDCSIHQQTGGEFHKDCCDGCKLGLLAGSLGQSCSFNTFSFGFPWDEAFEECCRDNFVLGPLGPTAEQRLPATVHSIDLHDNELAKLNRCESMNPCQHQCKDNGIVMECSCNKGFQLASDQKSCTDIDECLMKTANCDPATQRCANTDGGYLCLNDDGSFVNPNAANPIRPPHPSSRRFQHAFQSGNHPGSTCPIGYIFSAVTRTCNDINECLLGNHNCNANSHNCQNTIGSYLCIEKPTKRCPPGYKYNHNLLSCFDIDECAEGLDYCNRDREFCLNTVGGYECQPKAGSQCPAGYKFNAQIGSCEDVNECDENLHNCQPDTEQCRNTVGGYECDVKCEQGFRFSLIQRTCLDVDECTEDLYDCNEQLEQCVNTVGSYDCIAKAKCPAGYKPTSEDENLCEDIDECEENLHSCDRDTEICLNDIGRYHCEPKASQSDNCAQGYRFNPTTYQCIDIDECAEGLHDCDPVHGTCINTQGGFRCQIRHCSVGYRLNRHTRECQDINECLEETHNCSILTSECINTEGGFVCKQLVPHSCLPGFRFNVLEKNCEDINECQERPDTCVRNKEVCINSIGSYICREIQCPEGYQPNATSRACEDINECERQSHNCTGHEACFNTIGGFLCRASQVTEQCSSGHMFNEGSQRCEDVNECLEASHTCNPEKEVCINTVGSFLCRTILCPTGYRPNILARTCVDINECEENLHTCTEQEDCENRIGGYNCVPAPHKECHEGFIYSPATRKCEDVDECELGFHNCHTPTQICVNFPGSYRCHGNCPQGFDIDPRDHSNCKDIDECAEGLDDCNPDNQECVNSEGSYECRQKAPLRHQCPPGYQYSGVTARCEDIDECVDGSHQCITERQDCINTPGSYQCHLRQQCPQGYRLENRTRSCADIDECSEQLHNCDLTTKICVNSYGGFHCQDKPRPTCDPGHRYSDESQRCEDIDECVETPNVCNQDTQICVNGVGTYRCVEKPPDCPQGYRYDASISGCKDIDECAETPDVCVPQTQTCVNAVGSFRCVAKQPECPRGYQLDPTSSNCHDINECMLGTHDCDSSQYCVNTLGSYQCQSHRAIGQQCGTGFRFNSDTGSCVDINECLEGEHNCKDNEDCVNQLGGFQCIARPTTTPPPTTSRPCPSGYQLHPRRRTCVDINECTQNLHNCQPHVEICINLNGGFRCRVRGSGRPSRNQTQSRNQTISRRCPAGFLYNDTYRRCVDINECKQPGLCRRHQVCINTVGSFKCENQHQCGPGFELTEAGNQCIDVDECARNIHECRSDQTCINRQGGYSCQCPIGYTMNVQRECEDIDECSRFGQICTEHGECQNTPGSYMCTCKEGFKQTEDGKTCIDVNECDQPYVCQQKCINTWGSFQCSCEQGFNLASDKRSCQDIDECTLWKGRGNLCIGLCVNEPGSYSCRCPDGYKLGADKRTCLDIDECQGQVCTGENEVCLNTRGGHRCNTVVCPPNYIRDTDHRNRCKRESLVCQQGDSECLKLPLSYSYNFITFVSNIRIPNSGQIDLFTMRGPQWSSTAVHFNLEMLNARAPSGVEEATREFFHLKRTAHNQAVISLVRSIQGPQEIELELTLKMYQNGLFGGIAIAKIFLYVSQYEF